MPLRLRLRLLKVAMPLDAATVAVPDSTPGPEATAMVIMVLAPVMRFPDASRISTVIGGAMLAPAFAFDGWVVNASSDGAPAAMSNAAEAATARPVAVALSE